HSDLVPYPVLLRRPHSKWVSSLKRTRLLRGTAPTPAQIPKLSTMTRRLGGRSLMILISGGC
ncbi:mCG1042219, partial [Mus musculus]